MQETVHIVGSKQQYGRLTIKVSPERVKDGYQVMLGRPKRMLHILITGGN